MSSAGFWSNYDCETKFQSICMTYNTIYTNPTKPTTAVPLKCANGWSDSDNACYKVHSIFNLSFKFFCLIFIICINILTKLYGPKDSKDKLNW